MSARILVVDDDPTICEVICFALEKAQMRTERVGDGAAALLAFARYRPDLIVLDVGLPEMDGLSVCREIRKNSDVPILFLSARDEEIDRILGLEMGGDDYVTKPFSPRELVARVSAILKRVRSAGEPEPVEEAPPVAHGALHLDPTRFEAHLGAQMLSLTAIEFMMLKALAARPGVVLSREQLMAQAYDGTIHVSDRTIDSHIRNIRAKCAALACVNAIETVHGVGFRLGPCDVTASAADEGCA
ncbi:MAG: response regulator transcription factor [Neomegalonema sp.]|nr:response regulator transcription factor [Neomegalonema sp.]